MFKPKKTALAKHRKTKAKFKARKKESLAKKKTK